MHQLTAILDSSSHKRVVDFVDLLRRTSRRDSFASHDYDMAYATRSRASRVKREADSSAEAAQVEVDHDGEGDHAGGDALSVEGSDAPELAYGLSTATRPESEQEEGDEMNVDEEGDEDGSDGSDNSDSSSEASYDSRSEGELEDTAAEMRELETAVELNGTFVLVDRLGEGACLPFWL